MGKAITSYLIMLIFLYSQPTGSKRLEYTATMSRCGDEDKLPT